MPAAPFGISIGIRNGLTRRGPSVWFVMTASCRDLIPPIADETSTPILPEFDSVISSPELASASLAAATPSCSKRSRRLASFESMYLSGSNPFTSAAKCTFKGDESNNVIGPTPETPSIAFFQLSCTVNPSGFTVPIPVITTRSIHSSQIQDYDLGV